jgi:membrane associated rhomboid family serine protease
MSPTVKFLLIANVVVFVLDILTRGRLYFLAYNPYYAIRRFFIWQFVTYMFMHAGIRHILFNMLPLWMFGCDVERKLGRESFITVYLLCGLCGVGLFTLSHLRAINNPGMTTLVGASAAVCGILVAFAMIFPERRITLLVFFVFPLSLKAKHLVLGFFVIEVLNELSHASGNVAHLAHLGGMVFAYFYMKFKFRLSLPFAFTQGVWRRIKDYMHMRRFRHPRRRQRYTPVDSDAFISEEIDPILDKISRHGMKSLTWRERRILKKARSKMK